MVFYEYFIIEIKFDEKILYLWLLQYICYYMFNGRYMDVKELFECFVNDIFVEGLCYFFGVKFCFDLCKGYN